MEPSPLALQHLYRPGICIFRSSVRHGRKYGLLEDLHFQ